MKKKYTTPKILKFSIEDKRTVSLATTKPISGCTLAGTAAMTYADVFTCLPTSGATFGIVNGLSEDDWNNATSAQRQVWLTSQSDIDWTSS